MEIPVRFLERMEMLLGDEFASFLQSYQNPPQNGLRVNTLKISPSEFFRRFSFQLTPLSFCLAGFNVSEQDKLSRHPYHAAGLYYLQEPSGMAAVELLDPQPGETILDLAAAPGGKATQIAAKLDNQGLLIANDVHPRRVWELVQNLERWGIRNCCVLNETPQRLADRWEGYFDRVLLDAPCSGEGMFRKSENARRDWSEETVRSCAVRQAGILPQAAKMVKPGGRLVYSTCTFSPEENEQVIAEFIRGNPQFSLEVVKPYAELSPGHPDWIQDSLRLPELVRTVRLWPHRMQGEGHFMAVLHRKELGKRAPLKKRRTETISRTSQRLVSDFFDTFMRSKISIDNIIQIKKYIYTLQPNLPDLSGLRVIRPGWFLGTMEKERFEPAHALAMGSYAQDALMTLPLSSEGKEVFAYLRGNPLPASTGIEPASSDGWCLMLVDGFPIGWGKVTKGMLKNFYPRGLRIL